MKKILFYTFFLSLCSSFAHADCVWRWDCSSGSCKHVSICSNALDIVSPEPPSVSPIAPPSIKPINTPIIPPVGTSQCHQKYICDNNGDCNWQQICE